MFKVGDRVIYKGHTINDLIYNNTYIISYITQFKFIALEELYDVFDPNDFIKLSDERNKKINKICSMI